MAMLAQPLSAGGTIEKVDACVNEVASDTTITLQEVAVRANFADEHETALSLTTLSPQHIRLYATRPNYVEMMQGVPGVYATSSTGTYGDGTLNMRGFKQDNIAILLNGIPIQGLTSGSMYWSNWMGLADATYAVQIQKGMGHSMLADCAMGGMVNIITRTSQWTPSASFGISTTDTGLTKGTLNYSTGRMRNGWSVDAVLAYTKGHGKVECSDVETMSYMLTVSKLIGAHNTVIFNAIGSPEEHDQRNTELTMEEVYTYGRNYSKNWGMLRGKPYSIARNHYVKPYFTLQHILDGERFEMKNSLYLAIADGGGRSTYGQRGAQSIISHQTADGHIDFDAVIRENEEAGASQNIMIDYLSGHTQSGALATASYRLTPEWKLNGGVHYQYYDTWSKMRVLDLLGGTSWYDSTSGNYVGIGDYTGARYGRTTHHLSAFAQIEAKTERLTASLGVSMFNGAYRRSNFITRESSEWAHGTGASIKAGLLYHLAPAHTVYVNGAYNSRLPYAGIYLASSDLSITNDVKNETNILGEAGYRASWQGGGLELSAYLASWRDKTLTLSLAKRANEAAEKYQVSGLDALHAGVELTVHQEITSWLKAKAYAMTASWKWQSSGEALIYDSYSGETLNTYTINCDGLHVGDAPQTQLGATLDATLYGGLYANVSWQFNARMYADFEPSSRVENGSNVSSEVIDAYQLPSYHVMDATIGWRGTVSKGVRINVFAAVKNAFDTKYIERGIDGANHDAATFRGYWGTPRTVTMGVRFTL